MPPDSSDLRATLSDFGSIIGISVFLAGVLTFIIWRGITEPRYVAPSQEAFFEIATGVWDWASDSSCVANPQRIEFSADRSLMLLTMGRKWAGPDGDSTRVAVYDLSERSPSHVRGAIRGEERLTEAGEPVVWDLVLLSPDKFAWHRADWGDWATTASLERCPEGTDSLIPPLTAEEQAVIAGGREVGS
jgi:hypothetical protein